MESSRDPRIVLARQKYFSIRPRPLEQWLWRQGLPPSAERVFWLHWQEGMINGDWCSAISLKRVASLCSLDISSVSRAYQILTGLELIRRQDPGRDPARPFERAIAITEVRVPRALLQELGQHADRPRATGAAAANAAPERPEPRRESPPAEASTCSRDPFAGLNGRQRLRAMAELLGRMSANERRQYDEALRTHRTHMSFDEPSALGAEERGRVLLLLAITAPRPLTVIAEPGARTATESHAMAHGETRPMRRLSIFELARLRREIQALVERSDASELLRQVAWSIEEGALRRFTALHAMRIALKKIREGAWTRPNRMPPNWARALGGARSNAVFEPCRSA